MLSEVSWSKKMSHLENKVTQYLRLRLLWYLTDAVEKLIQTTNVVLSIYPRDVQKLVASRGDLYLTEERNSTVHLRDLIWLFKKRDCLWKVAFGSYCCIYAVSDSANTVTLCSKKADKDKMKYYIFNKIRKCYCQ